MAQNPPAVTTRPGGQAGELERMSERGDALRTAIGRDVRDVQSRAREAFDLRRQIARHPFAAAAVVLGGVLLAARMVKALLGGPRGRCTGRGRGKRSQALAAESGASPERARSI
jgi:hypothetical protein